LEKYVSPQKKSTQHFSLFRTILQKMEGVPPEKEKNDTADDRWRSDHTRKRNTHEKRTQEEKQRDDGADHEKTVQEANPPHDRLEERLSPDGSQNEKQYGCSEHREKNAGVENAVFYGNRVQRVDERSEYCDDRERKYQEHNNTLDGAQDFGNAPHVL
jgi:hypothetical protein